MPQPIRSYKHLQITPHAVVSHKNPKFAKQVAFIASEWASAEVEIAQHLSFLLNEHAETALPMYLTLRSQTAKRDALTAIAKNKFSKDDQQEFETLMRNLYSAGSSRNDVIHGIWALSNDFPDDLIWVKPDELLMHNAIMNAMMESNDYGRIQEVLKFKELMRYNEKDFGNIARRIRVARIDLVRFISPRGKGCYVSPSQSS